VTIPSPVSAPEIGQRLYLASPDAADGAAGDATADALGLTRARMELLGRLVVVYREPGAGGEALAKAALSADGKGVFDAGWGGGVTEPTGPGRLLVLAPSVPPHWQEVPDVGTSVAWTDADGNVAAVLRKLVLCGRWVKVAVPAGVLIPKRFRSNWFDTACTEALLNPAALDLWRASPR
jgi:hypothetical protein